MKQEIRPLIGFIGQGFIGKNYADDFEKRGFEVVRYARDEKYAGNKERIAECDIVFIAVPTPSTPNGFDDSILQSVLPLVGKGNVAVMKSTILAGTTQKLQKKFPDILLLHSPEFLTEATAAHDATHPQRNIVGIPKQSQEYREAADIVMQTLPRAPYELICDSTEAELIKYGGNNWFFFKVIFINMLYDLAQKLDCDWSVIRDGLAADPRIGTSHMNPVHDSGTPGGHADEKLPFGELHLEPVHKGGRGAGGHCFIKDFAAFSEMYENMVGDEEGKALLKRLKDKNVRLLLESNKDIDLLKGVYGTLK